MATASSASSASSARNTPAPGQDLDALLIRTRELKAVIKSAEDERVGKNLDGVECQLVALMDEHHIEQTSVDLDGILVTGSLVKSTTLNIDEARLKKALGSKIWEAITTKTLDKAKLEDAIARNLISPTMVAECSVETPRRPYIKITERVSRRWGKGK